MKLSTRGRYGMRALLDLALRYGEAPVLIRDIASRQEVSPHYLEQIVIVLKSAGLVKSHRGAKGGITLARPPAEVSLGEALEALEGSIAPTECVDDASSCSRSALCATRDIWMEMRNAMDKVVSSKSLQDLIVIHKRKEVSKAGMYNI